MNTSNKKKRLRRVVLLCSHFVRNLAYHRAGHDKLTGGTYSQVLVTIDSNFLDTAVIEWCKIFGDKGGKHYWKNIVSQPDFETTMLSHLGMTNEEFCSYIKEIRFYRDKFLAHLDNEDIMNIPSMNVTKKAALFFHDHVVNQEALSGDLDGLPTNLMRYYMQCFEEMRVIVDRCDL